MHVNAQVTAVTTMMEFSGNGINFIIFLVLGGHGKFTSSALYMLLHFVVLSYAFLMNTRYNKNRIIEYGWLNVVKNILMCNKRNVGSCDNNNPGIPNLRQYTRKTKNTDTAIDKLGTSTVSNSQTLSVRGTVENDLLRRKTRLSRLKIADRATYNSGTSTVTNGEIPLLQNTIENLFHSNTKPPEEKIGDGAIDKLGTSTVSNTQNLTLRSTIGNQPQCTTKPPEVFIISCNVRCTPSKDIKRNLPDTSIKEIAFDAQIDQPSCSNEFEDADSDNIHSSSMRESSRYNNEPLISRNREKLLDNLLSSLNDEKTYVYNIMRLVELEEAHKNHMDVDILGDDISASMILELPHFVGSSKRKIEMRSNLIDKLSIYKYDDEIYNEHFEYLMGMEENLIENGC